MFGMIPRRYVQRAVTAVALRPPASLGMMAEFAPVLERFFGRWLAPFEPLWEEPEAWGLEVEDKGPEVVVRAEMPGFEAAEIEVLRTGELLTMRAEHKRTPEGEKKEEVIERRLERTVVLPAGTDLEKVEARYRAGVLEVHLPKTPEAVTRRIEVKT
jgi:HSP20 family protein